MHMYFNFCSQRKIETISLCIQGMMIISKMDKKDFDVVIITMLGFLAICASTYYYSVNGFDQLIPDFDSLGHIYAYNSRVFDS